MLVAIARDGTHEDQQHAADSLWRLSRAVGESRADEHLVGIVRSGGVSPLATLLRDGTTGTFPSGQAHGKKIAVVLYLTLRVTTNGWMTIIRSSTRLPALVRSRVLSLSFVTARPMGGSRRRSCWTFSLTTTTIIKECAQRLIAVVGVLRS